MRGENARAEHALRKIFKAGNAEYIAHPFNISYLNVYKAKSALKKILNTHHFIETDRGKGQSFCP